MRRQMNKLLVIVSGIVVSALLALMSFWRGCIYSPNTRFSAVLFGVPALALYLTAVVIILRLKKRIAGGQHRCHRAETVGPSRGRKTLKCPPGQK